MAALARSCGQVMMQDFYDILEVLPDATLAEIKRAYRRLARLHHPDLNKQALDSHIKRLNEAYEILRDPRKRAAYDEQRAEAERQVALRLQAQAKREPGMTWYEGFVAFVNELKKGLNEE
ncbi:MAG TPA: DnaJ domain-containing protein [Ktedonobacteraceae bacterium]|nr:DnaJ domain-containing protein [Ktedonobacteraceae bacterium]